MMRAWARQNRSCGKGRGHGRQVGRIWPLTHNGGQGRRRGRCDAKVGPRPPGG